MKIRFVFLAVLLSFACLDAGWAGGRCGGGRWNGGYCGPAPVVGRGWCGPAWGGWGWGPSFAFGFSAPVAAPVYQTVYVPQTAPVYTSYSAPIVAKAQSRLARLGYYGGAVDGDFGPKTNRAVRLFQTDYGLPVTGVLDRRTLAILGV